MHPLLTLPSVLAWLADRWQPGVALATLGAAVIGTIHQVCTHRSAKLRRHAEGVHAQVTVKRPDRPPGLARRYGGPIATEDLGFTLTTVYLTVHNNAPSSITDVECAVPPALHRGVNGADTARWVSLPPGVHSREVRITPHEVAHDIERQVRIRFTDVNGRRWERDAAGVLSEAP